MTATLLGCLTASAATAPTDLLYPPANSGGHDFNHAPIGQTFVALASDVHAGIYVADQGSFTDWLSTIYPGQIAPGSYPYQIAPSLQVQIDLMAGEGNGTVLHSVTRTLAAPFAAFVDVDYGAEGIRLTVGQTYTLLLTDVSNQSYPQGVTGWVVPSVTDPTSGQSVTDSSGNVVGYLPYGAYPSGRPILQGGLVANDAGVGDNAFQVIDNAPAPTEQIVSGVNAVITAYVPRNPGFIVINGGLQLNDHLWTTQLNPGNTTFLGGLVNWYQTGLLVDYTGIATPQGVLLTQLTVKPAPAPLVASITFADGTVGVPYSAALTVAGGVPPYTIDVTGLPAGLTFDGSNVIGTPTTAGSSMVNLSVTDSIGRATTASGMLTIKAPAANYTVRDEGKAKITALGSGYLMAGAKKLIWNSSTLITVNTPSGERHSIDAYVRVGMRVQWKGLLDTATGTVLASKIEIN